jgi:hypothetical protein
MSTDRLLIGVLAIAVLCFTGLVAQCSHRVGECKKEAIKAGIKTEDIRSICRE